MTAQLIDGKALATTIQTKLASELQKRAVAGLRPPGLAVILVGEDPASQIYVEKKCTMCATLGIKSKSYHLPETIAATSLQALIEQLNQDDTIDGILVQLPLPAHLNTQQLLHLIHPDKDVDGFHPENLGLLAMSTPRLHPCTPYGIMTMLDTLPIDLKGLNAVVIGASNIVGRPMALELLNREATVTICHKATRDLPQIVKTADLVVTATGVPNLVQGSWLKPGCIVIDVGITRTAAGKIVGDVDFATAYTTAGWITPVPGGVGPMTVITLMANTLIAAQLHQ